MGPEPVLERAVLALLNYILTEEYRGYDPYDGLTSPLASLPVLKKSRIYRVLFQQGVKWLPVNIRPLIGIHKGTNPVTIGLVLQGLSYLHALGLGDHGIIQSQIDKCLGQIEALSAKGYSGACWGYDFDWEARYMSLKSLEPTVVATGIVTNGMFVLHQLTGSAKAKELCVSAAEFVLKDLNRTYEGDGFCFSYSATDHQIVYNASMKGARLLAQVYALTRDENVRALATAAVSYVVRNQSDDGSWVYSKDDARSWTDNFHTGYILDCLDEYELITGDHSATESREMGMSYYTSNFFVDRRIPKYYSNSLYPIDATAIAQSILTLSRFGFLDHATDVAVWAIENMSDPAGFFYYRKHRAFAVRTSFMRWSNAWMFAALAFLLYQRRHESPRT